MNARAACLAACAAGLAITGCGTGADQREARSVAERFYAAVRGHDGVSACGLLAAELRKGDCAGSVVDLKLHGTRATAVSVYATSAQVRLDGGDTVFLGFTRDGWRIDAAGCRPVPGGGPLECEEQA